MNSSTYARRARAFAVAACLATLVAGCNGQHAVPSPEDEVQATGSARIAITLGNGIPTLKLLRLTVTPGNGPSFAPIVVDIQQNNGTWNTFVTGIPAGPDRLFEGVALDANGQILGSGSGESDITAGESAAVSFVIQLASPPPVVTSVPVLDEVAVPTTTVAPGSTTTLQATAHDPDGGLVTYLWTATCGGFDNPSQSTVAWTAPLTDPTTCVLTITVSDGVGASAAAFLTMTVTSARTITGSRLVTYWPDPPNAQVTLPPPDLVSAVAPSALVRDASGHWTVYPGGSLGADGTFVAGQFGSDGSFAVPGVPTGAYVLCYQITPSAQVCTETSMPSVDLGYDIVGRPDPVIATQPTPVTFILSGLDPWDPIREQVQITSSAADLWDVLDSFGELRGGDTGGVLVEDWSSANANEAAQNLLVPADVLFLYQLSTRPLYALGTVLFYTAATQATTQTPAVEGLTGITLTDGQASTVTAALAPLPLNASLTPSWGLSTFEAYEASLAPAQRMEVGPTAHTLRVGASAFALEYPAPLMVAGSPILLDFELPAGLGAVSGTLYYGRFLPSLWLEWLETSFTVQASYLAPGATTPITDSATVLRREAMPLLSESLVPAVSPVQAPQINGLDAQEDETAVTVTPTLAWAPPATGVPTAYIIEIFKLASQEQATTSTLVLRYIAQTTTFQIPPGFLEAGSTYYAKITGVVTSVPYDVAPFRTANIYEQAQVLTGTFAP
jgi:hypothetical protein